jgi:hypothetical protein
MGKLELKAYKCIFPSLFDYSDNPFDRENPKQYEVIYGKNQKEAVRDKCLIDEMYSFWELKQDIRTRRYKQADLYSQEKSDLLKGLADKQINHLTHSLGVKIGDI